MLSNGQRPAIPLERVLDASARMCPLRRTGPFYVAIATVERVVWVGGRGWALLHERLTFWAPEPAGTCAMEAQHNDGIRNQARNNEDAVDPQHERE